MRLGEILNDLEDANVELANCLHEIKMEGTTLELLREKERIERRIRDITGLVPDIITNLRP